MDEDYFRQKESSASCNAVEKESSLSRRSSLQSLDTDANRYIHIVKWLYLVTNFTVYTYIKNICLKQFSSCYIEC